MHTTISMPTRVLAGAAAVFAAAVLIVALGASAAHAAGPNVGFRFNAPDVTGGSSAVALTGAGAFNPSAGFAHSGGSFSCTSAVSSGPLAGCQTGEGVRWHSDSPLSSTMFKCLANEALKPVSTSDDTVVLHAGFSRAGDGSHASFNANMFVSTHDIDDAVPGVQNVWVQGVGCATAAVHFTS